MCLELNLLTLFVLVLSKAEIMDKQKVQKSFNANDFQQYRENKSLCDVNLIVENTSFPCHKLVLSANCDYFKNMFSGYFAEADKKEITIGEISADIFKIVLDYIYYQEISLAEENVRQLLGASCMLLLTDLKKSCVKFCESILSDSNVLLMIETAELYDLECLQRKCTRFIVDRFENMESAFLSLSSNAACRVLSNSDLPVTNEVQVAKAALKWLETNCEHSSSEIHKLMLTVRITECDPLFVKTVLIEHTILKKSLKTISMLSLYVNQQCFGLFLPKDIRLSFPRRSTGLKFQVRLSQSTRGFQFILLRKIYFSFSGIGFVQPEQPEYTSAKAGI